MQDLRVYAVAGSGQFGVTANLTAETHAAYERWAPLYPPIAHNPLMRAEERVMLEHFPPVAGRRVLDLACGSGRYSKQLAQRGAAAVVAMDFCMPMLRQVSAAVRVCGSMMQLPFAGDAFDVVISGLAIGHASSVHLWMAEVARVLTRGGTVLYSDFHPDAARMGLTRSFKDQDEQTCTVPHETFDLPLQRQAAAAVNLSIDVVHEVRVGVDLTEPFPRSEEFYRRWDGLPIVLIVRAQRST